jgi:hypothetical protein
VELLPLAGQSTERFGLSVHSIFRRGRSIGRFAPLRSLRQYPDEADASEVAVIENLNAEK